CELIPARARTTSGATTPRPSPERPVAASARNPTRRPPQAPGSPTSSSAAWPGRTSATRGRPAPSAGKPRGAA
ncbi:MAG: hypothetical protein AVDCRST_MAG57-540, partial [uncultured Blastococcus sp.]